jgi:cytochrome c
MNGFPKLVLPAATAIAIGAAVLTMGDDGVEVLLCDNATKISVRLDGTPTREDGQRIAAELMAKWQEAHPDQDWEAAERERHTIVPMADNRDLMTAGQGAGHTYGAVTEQDVRTWEREVGRMVAFGSLVFHDAKELGSTIAVSCDMCHPHASNTHPETYPKYQVQMGKSVLLRDMVNWCIEHPVRGKKLDPDDPKMRALEAYMYAQRKGTTLNYGRR